MDEQSKQAAPRRGGTRWFWIAFVAVIAAVLLHGHVRDGASKKGALPPEVSVVEAAALRDQGGYVLDVREPEEWKNGHLDGSTLIPLGQLPTRLAEVPRDRKIVVVCQSGNRSKRGRSILAEAGYAQVTSMAGGLSEWETQGRPTVSGP